MQHQTRLDPFHDNLYQIDIIRLLCFFFAAGAATAECRVPFSCIMFEIAIAANAEPQTKWMMILICFLLGLGVFFAVFLMLSADLEAAKNAFQEQPAKQH